MVNCQLTAVTRQVSVLLTYSFHQLIAHYLVSLETNIHLCDIIRFSLTYKSISGVGSQLSDMRTNYRIAQKFDGGKL